MTAIVNSILWSGVQGPVISLDIPEILRHSHAIIWTEFWLFRRMLKENSFQPSKRLCAVRRLERLKCPRATKEPAAVQVQFSNCNFVKIFPTASENSEDHANGFAINLEDPTMGTFGLGRVKWKLADKLLVANVQDSLREAHEP
ncbi:hypothetical protein TWF730_010428 [Orbilia blumenaviensis]|uniref:Uncharacterized protein n=1 Tax=Orbilia blumenaviensis TaxID=1796055 RepID=A0AAV9US31_9PEZI